MATAKKNSTVKGEGITFAAVQQVSFDQQQHCLATLTDRKDDAPWEEKEKKKKKKMDMIRRLN